MNTTRLKILLHRGGAVLALAGIGFVAVRLYNYSAAMDFSALGAGAWATLAACAVLYGLGKKKKYLHAVFHVFVDIGCVLHAVCILQYVL